MQAPLTASTGQVTLAPGSDSCNPAKRPTGSNSSRPASCLNVNPAWSMAESAVSSLGASAPALGVAAWKHTSGGSQPALEASTPASRNSSLEAEATEAPASRMKAAPPGSVNDTTRNDSPYSSY